VNLTSKPAEQSDFFRAVKNNDAPAILKMLDSGFDPNSYNSSGKTALHVAVLANAREAAHLLVEHGANPLRGTQDDPNHRPLEDAVNFNKPEMVEFLARHGGYVPGARVNGWSLLHRACEKGKTRTVEALLKAGADCNEMTDNGSTPLLIAVKLGQFEVVKILLQFSEVVATMDSFFVKTDERKRSAFHLAVNSGKMPIIAAMLEKGANVNSRDATEKTPLLAAIENGNLDLVRLLAEAGADLNKSCGSHGTPLVHACAVKNMVGDDRRRAEMVDLLIRLGADTDIPSPHGRLPLHLVMTGLYEKEVLESLLRYPVNREIQDKFGLLPIHLAAMIKEMGYLPVLLEAGVDPNSRSTDDATTPLIHAVRVQNIEGVRLLLQAGANPKLYDAHGKSALSYARENRYDDIIEMLEQALKYNFVQTKPAPPKPGPHPSSGT
jgi:ankyrin repeat protein